MHGFWVIIGGIILRFARFDSDAGATRVCSERIQYEAALSLVSSCSYTTSVLSRLRSSGAVAQIIAKEKEKTRNANGDRLIQAGNPCELYTQSTCESRETVEVFESKS